MKLLINLIIPVYLLASSVYALGADKVVVIPLNIQKRIKHVVTVAKNGGDFTDPVAAVNSITDASAENPYIIVIAPGIYNLNQQVVMKQHVSIVGAGVHSTKLTGPGSSGCLLGASAALISGANNSSLSEITIEHAGQQEDCPYSDTSVAIENINTSPTINNVKVIASGGNGYNIGIYNSNSSATLIDVNSTANGGLWPTGIDMYNSKLTLTNVFATASNGTTANQGIQINKSSPMMSNVTAILTEPPTVGTDNIGLVIYGESSPLLKDVLAIGKGSTYSVGAQLNANSTSELVSPTFQNCRIEGENDAVISFAKGTIRFVQSSIVGSIARPQAATNICLNSDNGFDKELDNNCNEIIP